MEKLSLKIALSQAWQQYARSWRYLFGLTIIVCFLVVATSGEYVTTALAYIVYAGYLVLLLRHARMEKTTYDDVFLIDQRWIYYAFHSLIKGILIGLGLVLFVVPGVYLMTRWMFSGLYVIDKGMRPLEAFAASSELTKGHRLKLFGFLLLCVLIMLAGLAFLIVGVFVAIAVINLAVIMLFWKAQEIQYLKNQSAEGN